MTEAREREATVLLAWARAIPYVQPAGRVCGYCFLPMPEFTPTGRPCRREFCGDECKTRAWEERQAA